MLEITRDELLKAGALTNDYAPIVTKVAQAIPALIPERMKYTIAATEAMLFASHLRRNILHWDGGLIPVNCLTFIFAKSGKGKDSSINAARKCFSTGYDKLEVRRDTEATNLAIRRAMEAGVDNPRAPENYADFYRAPEDIIASSASSIKGLTMHFNDLEDSGIGGGFIYTGEITAELASGNAKELMLFMSEVYDTGHKEVKLIGAKDEQGRTIRNLPVSAIFAGSQANLLENQISKNLFREEFSNRLARRSFFNFNPEDIPLIHYNSNEEMILAEIAIDDAALKARAQVNEGVDIISEWGLKHLGEPLEVSPKVRFLFATYKRYNQEVALQMSPLHPIATISREHMQWKALKMSGAYALYNQHERIEPEDYVHAINFCELLANDLSDFENELIKEPYQLFSDYMRTNAVRNQSSVSLHMLRKLGYIHGVGRMTDKLRDLCHLAASYDVNGVYTAADSGISYEGIEPVTTINITYKEIDNTPIFEAIKTGDKAILDKAKNQVATTANSGLEVAETTFAELGDLLKGDFAYSPYRFKDGIRNKDNLLPGTKWLVLDIDDSTITADEAHFILSDVNHHIALSSNPDNEFKFRVIVELEAVVTLDADTWRYFYKSIARELALNVDPLPQSQLFFSYSTSPVQSVLDGEPIKVRDHIMKANDDAKHAVPEKALTAGQKTSALGDTMATFNYAYDAPKGQRSRQLITAAHHAKELGAAKAEIIELVKDISDFWVPSMDPERLQRTIISQIQRF